MQTLCETDRRLINEVAKIWVDGGGDAAGIVWLWQSIKERVQEIEHERKQESE